MAPPADLTATPPARPAGPRSASRRALLGAALGGAGSAWLAGCASVAAPAGAAGCRVLVGSEDGLLRAWWLPAGGGALQPQGVVAQVARPRWLLADAPRGLLHVASDPAGASGQVHTLAVDRAGGPLRPLASAPSGGPGATHLAADPAGGAVLVANFGHGSVASLALDAAGAVTGAPVSSVQAQGSGPHRRQASAHAHGVLVAPGGRHVLVADLGADRVFIHRWDASARRLQADPALPAWVAPPGSGPRQLLQAGPQGRRLYLVHELGADVTVLDWDAEGGRLRHRQTVALGAEPMGVPAAPAEARSAAGAVASADGRVLYVLDRGASALEVHAVAPDSGTLTLRQRLPSGGDQPWALALDPSGAWLLVVHARGRSLALFAVGAADGRLVDTGVRAEVPAPLSVTCLG